MGDDVNPLVLRVATLSDADILLAWRNDRETRRQSKSTDKVEQSSHVSWLTAVLNDDDRALYIGMDGDEPVGSVRADRDAEIWTLSWMGAPTARKRGVGRRIVDAMIARLDGEIRADVKIGNVASMRIAERCGMTQMDADNDFTYWRMKK